MKLKPTPNQQAFIQSPAKFTLFGGARGGGKTFAVIIDWLIHSESYGRDARGLVVRRSLTELEDFIEAAKDVLETAGHVWKESKHCFVSPNGAILRCRYLERDQDANKYQGHAYTRVYVEEIGNFPLEAPIKKLYATLRSAKGVPCQFKATANPGGPGHSWVKLRFISPAAPRTPFTTDSGKTYSIYIPSLLQDNPHLMENDPEYVSMLRMVGTPELVKAWLEGDWDVVVGQYFPEFSRAKHVIPTVRLPDHWDVRYRAQDWGSSRPYAVLWFAVATGETLPGCPIHIPRGALVVYRELYGWNGTPNVGTRETARAVGMKVRMAEASDYELIDRNSELNKIDPATFATNGGPSIAEEQARGGAWFVRADNRRVAGAGAMGGWDQVRARLRGEDFVLHEDGTCEIVRPMLYFMDSCVHIIRTLPTLPIDPDKPDDLDSDAEDHAADALRYGCMARMYEPPPPVTAKKIDPLTIPGLQQIRLQDAWADEMYHPSYIRRN